jgi:hypothetical protein
MSCIVVASWRTDFNPATTIGGGHGLPHTAFVFHGRAGRINVHNEQRTPAKRYWYAYRLTGQRAKRYLGKTANLTLERLEQVAGELSSGQVPSPRASRSPSPAARAQMPAAVSAAAHAAKQPLLLATKLAHPRLPAALVVRERLLLQLDAAPAVSSPRSVRATCTLHPRKPGCSSTRPWA